MRRAGRFVFLLVAAALTALLAPAVALGAGNDVGRNIGSTLRQFAEEGYGGVIAIVGLVFLLNRRFTELATFLLAALVVGWLVFSPDQVAAAARALGDRILP